MTRALVRSLYWIAVTVVVTVLLIAIHYAVALVWPAYLIGALALLGIAIYDGRRRVIGRRAHH